MSRTAGPKKDPATGTWRFIVDIGMKDGKRRQARRRGFPTKKEAQEALDALRVSVTEHSYIAPSRQTVSEYLLDDWLPRMRHDLKRSTAESYERYLRLHAVPHIGGVKLADLEPGHLDRLYTALRTDGSRLDGKPGALSPRTIRYVHTILRKALADAVHERRLRWNPAVAAKPGKASADVTRPEMTTWSAEELTTFLRAESQTGYGPLWVFLAMTGCRRGEALGLRWSDITVDCAQVTLSQTLVSVNHKPVFERMPKSGKPRTISLDAKTSAVLRALRANQAAERLAFGPGYDGAADLVFTLIGGRYLHPDRVSREFERRIERHGLRRIRLHDLRHTWATLALAANMDVKIVSERLGHASTTITRDIYQHVTPVMHTAAAETVAALIDF